MTITFLCKVVDNFGDIGVVYRLSKQISQISKNNIINLVTDNLVSFNRICSKINPSLEYQQLDNLHIFNWNSYDYCYSHFNNNDGKALEVILECFQCGRPDWMEKILFEDKLQHTVQIIMLDYLTAEDYAETFHCLESLTRSKSVKKVNFMPGFTQKTGGLIIDDLWKTHFPRDCNGPVLFFTYEKDFIPYFKALNRWNRKDTQLLLAQGKGRQSFINCYNQTDKKQNNFSVKELEYINQDEWDLLMQKCSILVIRGEESLSRACLSGIPFVWNAYPQSEEYQLVKVKALLERMRNCFNTQDFAVIERFWIAFNTNEKDVSEVEREESFLDFLNKSEELVYGFVRFAEELRKNGDLATNLMTYIEKNVII